MNEIINLDSEFAQEIGFTSDKFFGYLWRDNSRVIISAIMSKSPNKGHFTQLLKAIEDLGLKVEIPTPSLAMWRYLAKRNFVPRKEWDSQPETIEVWARSPAFLGVERQPQPQEVWRHFKGNEYQIMAVSNSAWIPPNSNHALIAKDSETEELLAVYFHEYGVTLARGDGGEAVVCPHVIYFSPDNNSKVWARELNDFLGFKDDKFRFEKV